MPCCLQENQQDRERRAAEWLDFRRRHLLSQRELVDLLANAKCGISRRTVQMVETARITPHPGTLRRFRQFTKSFRRMVA